MFEVFRISPLVIVRLAATLRIIVRQPCDPAALSPASGRFRCCSWPGKANIEHLLRAFVDNLESPLFLIRS
jgi:hypothetical protein